MSLIICWKQRSQLACAEIANESSVASLVVSDPSFSSLEQLVGLIEFFRQCARAEVFANMREPLLNF